MTPKQKKKMEKRNDAICACYAEGKSLAECGRKFGLGRQRVQQILKKAGAWRPHTPSGRTNHVGVTVTQETKKKLKELADENDMSVSELTAKALDELVKE